VKLIVRTADNLGVEIDKVTLNSSCMDVRYSNVGLSDTIELLLDEVPIGFKTLAMSDEGRMWNVFRNSRTIGNLVSLSAGQHTLKLIVRTDDKPGVEIDKVTLNSSCIPGYSSNATDYGQLSTGIIAIVPNGRPTSDAGVTSIADDSAELAKIVIPPVIGVAGILSTVLLGTNGIYCKYKSPKGSHYSSLHLPELNSGILF